MVSSIGGRDNQVSLPPPALDHKLQRSTSLDDTIDLYVDRHFNSFQEGWQSLISASGF